MSFRTRRMGVAIAASVLVATVGLAPPASAVPIADTVTKLTKAVKISQVMNHLKKLQHIADDNDGDRAAGLPGYGASVDYVVDQLEHAGYTPQVQEFPFTYAEENSALSRANPATTWVDGQDFLRNNFDTGSPEGTATGTAGPGRPGGAVPGATEPAPAGASRRTSPASPRAASRWCSAERAGSPIKALNAQAAGASAVDRDRTTAGAGLVGMIGDATGLTIPAIFVASPVGEDLASTPGATVTVTVDYFAEERTAFNVLAETGTGDDSNVVMAGAHLDSVQEGPGINDNGTGSAALLETAIQMQRVKPTNTVRFAWWGAEEEGLLGSEYYVANLSEEQADDIALYLNFDMIGSPNYFYGVYDGDNSSGTAPDGFIPEGSAAIEDVFEQFYDSQGLPYQDTDFSGRSDYGPFIAVGIPAGGLFTGAEDIKTADEAALYGGLPGESYDPCYHQACDNLTGDDRDEANEALYDALDDSYRHRLTGNVNRTALDVNSDALAAAVITFAFDTSTRERRGERVRREVVGGRHPAAGST